MQLEFDSLTIANIEELHETLLAFSLSQESVLELDLHNVNKIDLSAIQLFLSLQKTLQKENRKLQLTHCTNGVIAALALCGCEKILAGACQ